MFYVVTLSLRTISAIERSSTRRSAAMITVQTQIPGTQSSTPAFPQKYNEALVHSLFLGLSKPIPDHVTFPPRVDILPARILLFYLDSAHARAVLKTKPVNESFCIGVGQYRRIVADISATTETEMRAFIRAAGVVKNVSRLRKQDLVTALVLGDYRKAAADRTRITALHGRLEVKAGELRKRVGELKMSEIKLAALISYVDGGAMKVGKQKANLSSASTGWVTGEAYPHRYPTRYSLTTSSVEEDS